MPDKVAIIGTDYPEHERYCPNFTGMLSGLQSMGVTRHLFSCRPTLDIDAVVDYNPDLIVYGLLDMVKNEKWRQELRHRLPKAKIVMWYGDYRDARTGQIGANMGEIDAMFVSNDAQSEYYRDLWKVPSCSYLPLGSPLYPQTRLSRLSFPFVFIGAISTRPGMGPRALDIIELKKNAGLKVINGTSDEMRLKVFKAMPMIYASSKISLDQSHFTDVPRYTSNRHWIIPASGGFALTKRFPGCELDYPEGTRAYYDSVEELLELCTHYLTASKERENIRQAGYEHAKNHTYENRFARMFQMTYASTANKSTEV